MPCSGRACRRCERSTGRCGRRCPRISGPELAGTELPLRAVRSVLTDDQRILVAVDQFEEVFTLCPDEGERAAFIAALAEAATDPAGRAAVVVAVRADYYGRCAAYPELAELLGANHLLVGSMSTDEYRRAIEQPALRAGVRVDPALVDALVEDVEDEPGALPLLSTSLLELWRRRDGRRMTMAAYVETGGVRGAVARLAEEAYAALTEPQRDVIRGVMLRLAGPGEGDAIVRRRAPLSEFDAENPDVGQVLATLTTRRLVTVDEGTVEVAHEALLREWPRLRGWVEEDREGRRLRAHLIEAARGWESGGEDAGELYRGARLATAIDWTAGHSLELNELERRFLSESRAATDRESARQRRTNRRLRGLLVGTALFLVLALVAGALALVQRGRAEDAAVAAQTAATAAERSATEATAQRLGAQALVQKDLDLTLLLARQGTELDDSVLTRGNLLAALVRSPAAIGIARPATRAAAQGVRRSEGRLPGGRLERRPGGDPRPGLPADDEDLRRQRGSLMGDTLISRPAGNVRPGGPGHGGDRDPLRAARSGLVLFGSPTDVSEIALGACDGSSITTYDTETAAPLLTVTPDEGWTFADVWYAPDGRLLTLDHEGPFDPAAFTDPIRYTLRDPNTGEVSTSVLSPDGMVPYAFSPDGTSLALGRADGGITVHDLQSGGARDLHGRHNEAREFARLLTGRPHHRVDRRRQRRHRVGRRDRGHPRDVARPQRTGVRAGVQSGRQDRVHGEPGREPPGLGPGATGGWAGPSTPARGRRRHRPGTGVRR